MGENTVVRDSMAKHRTNLANERTLLAYSRTALAFFISGAVVLRLDHSSESILIAKVLTVAGILISLVGIYRFVRYRKKVKK